MLGVKLRTRDGVYEREGGSGVRPKLWVSEPFQWEYADRNPERGRVRAAGESREFHEHVKQTTRVTGRAGPEKSFAFFGPFTQPPT